LVYILDIVFFALTCFR